MPGFVCGCWLGMLGCCPPAAGVCASAAAQANNATPENEQVLVNIRFAIIEFSPFRCKFGVELRPGMFPPALRCGVGGEELPSICRLSFK
ncbi:MAG: hypothetical protein WAM85_22825 [Terracidiphilus sp.]